MDLHVAFVERLISGHPRKFAWDVELDRNRKFLLDNLKKTFDMAFAS
jgi:hypothetical protein